MSKLNDDIKQELSKFAEERGPSAIINATVVFVDETNSSLTVKLDSGLELDDVRLRSVIKAGNKVVLLPAVGSNILIGRIEGGDDYVVIAVEEIDKIIHIIGTVKIEIDLNGILIQKGTETLKKILDDLLAQIKLIIVPTNVGPSGNPLNAAAFDIIKTRVDNLLK